MIAIALNEKTIEVSEFNTSFNEDKQTWELWGTKKGSGKSFRIVEGVTKERVSLIKQAIDKAIESGEYLFDLKEGE